ncbi:hypothetical protein L9F63_013039, partial [Diploptera punctata]
FMLLYLYFLSLSIFGFLQLLPSSRAKPPKPTILGIFNVFMFSFHVNFGLPLFLLL